MSYDANAVAANYSGDTVNVTTEETIWFEPNLTAVGETFSHNGSQHYQLDLTEEMFYYYLWTYAAPITLGAITLVGTVGNSLVIYVIVSGHVTRTVTNILLLNLALADIAFLIVCVPITAHKYAASSWDFGDVVCKLVQYFIYVTAYVTVWSLVAVSALRFLTVVCSASTTKCRTERNIGVLIAAIWLLSLVVNIPTMLAYTTKTIGTYRYCGMHARAIEAVFLCFFVFAYALPLAIIVVLYVLILVHLHRAKKAASTTMPTRTHGRMAKACRVIVVVVLVFGISWLPLHINYLVSYYGQVPKGAYYEVFRVLWNCMAYGNSCVNPIIYNYVSNDFRRGFREVCCQKLRLRPMMSYGRTSERQTETEMTQMLETKA